MSRAEDLLNRIVSAGSPEIFQMISQQYTEDLFLDYKQSNTSFPSRSLDQFDRKNFAKSLSGFGNSDGGLVIWGVKCDRQDDGDIPREAKLIENAAAFKSLLDGEMSGLTLPPSSRARNVAVLHNSGPQGFVLTHIPPGYDIPLYSTNPNARGYYLRAGSSFQAVPPGVLAGMFGRRPNPELKLSVLPEFEYSPGAGQYKILFKVSVSNEGRGLGRRLYLRAHADDTPKNKYFIHYDTDTWDALVSIRHKWALLESNAHKVLPPDVAIGVCGITFRSDRMYSEDLEISISVGCEGGTGDERTLRLYSSTLKSISEILCEQSYRSDQYPMLSRSIYRFIDTDQSMRGYKCFDIPGRLLEQ